MCHAFEVIKVLPFIVFPTRSAPLELPGVSLFIVFPSVFWPWSYKSVVIYCVPYPTGAFEATEVSPLSWRLRSYESVAISKFFQSTCAILAPSKLPKRRNFCFPHPSSALEVTNVCLFIVFPPDLRPRSYQNVVCLNALVRQPFGVHCCGVLLMLCCDFSISC